ncbi:MAG: 30S ribosomal protein THX [Burkholderiales bacterium]|nr:30S ribosomal protein THX [Burkholderiales bacterium]
MGKGDVRTRRGKIYRGTHGNTRSRKTNRPVQPKKKKR